MPAAQFARAIFVVLLPLVSGCHHGSKPDQGYDLIAAINRSTSGKSPSQHHPLSESDFHCYRRAHDAALRLAGDGVTDCGMSLDDGGERDRSIESCGRAAASSHIAVVVGELVTPVDSSYCTFVARSADGSLWNVQSFEELDGEKPSPVQVFKCEHLSFPAQQAPFFGLDGCTNH